VPAMDFLIAAPCLAHSCQVIDAGHACAHQTDFERPSGARVTSPLLVQRRSNQEETTPRWRALRPSMGSGCAGGLRGFPTAHPCTGEKLARIHAGHPADFPSPTRRAIGAPGRAARSSAQMQRQVRERELQACDAFALASSAHDARLLLWGPWPAVRRGRQGRAAGESMDGLAFSRGQARAWMPELRQRRSSCPMPARKAPAPTHGLAVHGWTASANRGVVFSWLLLLDSGHPALRPSGRLRRSHALLRVRGTSKREVARTPTGARNRFVAGGKAPLPPTPLPRSSKQGHPWPFTASASGRGEPSRTDGKRDTSRPMSPRRRPEPHE